MGCIYKITNIVNGKAYIGKCERDVEKTRIRDHLNGKTHGRILKAVRKYGKDAFTWEILHDGIIPELLNSYEIEAIKTHKTLSPSGYNLTRGGDGGNTNIHGRKRSLETRRKMSEKATGRKHTPETIKKLSEMNSGENHRDYGKHLSAVTRQRIGDANRGRKRTLEERRKISEALKGKSSWNKGISPSDETCRKISESLKGENNPFFGKKLTKEEIRKRTEPRKSPERKRTYQVYLTLPADLDVKEKRARLRELTGYSVLKIWRWVKAWEQGET